MAEQDADHDGGEHLEVQTSCKTACVGQPGLRSSLAPASGSLLPGFSFRSLDTCIDDRECGHVDDPPHADRRLQDVRRLGSTEQDGADGYAAAGGDLEQVVGNVGGIDAAA